MIKYTNIVIIFLKLFITFAHLPQGSYKKMQPLMALHLLHDTTTKILWWHLMSCQGKLPWCEFTPVVGVRISLWYEISWWYHVNANWPHVSVWNQSADRLEWAAHAQCLQFWITHVFYQLEVYLQILRYEMTQSLWNAMRNEKVIPVWNSRWYKFSHVKTP